MFLTLDWRRGKAADGWRDLFENRGFAQSFSASFGVKAPFVGPVSLTAAHGNRHDFRFHVQVGYAF